MSYPQPQQQQQQQQPQQYYQQPQQQQQYYQQPQQYYPQQAAQPYQQYQQYPQYQQYQQYQQGPQQAYPPQQQQQLQPYQQPVQQQQPPQQQQPQLQAQQQRGIVPQTQDGPKTEWQSSLMDCSPCESCLLGTWLPCILLGRTSERLKDPTLQNYETFNNECLMMCGITYLGCGWLYAMMKRSEIRERFNIEGSEFGDCCVAYWCTCCGLIQQEKEVIARTSAAAPVTQAYQPPKEGMVMPQPQQQAVPSPETPHQKSADPHTPSQLQ